MDFYFNKNLNLSNKFIKILSKKLEYIGGKSNNKRSRKKTKFS